MIRRGPTSSVLPILALTLVTSLHGVAQRKEAKADWQGHSAVITYGVPQVGKHTIEELQVGSTWRMGRNDASILTTDTILFAGDVFVPPGGYRCNIQRTDQDTFAINCDGGTLALDPSGGEGGAGFPGKLGKLDKPTKALELEVKPDKAVGKNQAVTVAVRFGPNEVKSSFTVAGAKAMKSPGWVLDVFTIPDDVFEKAIDAGKAVPVANLRKEPLDKKHPVWFNLVVSKNGASWCPPMEPTTSAFEAVKKPDSGAVVKATSATWSEAKEKKTTVECQVFDAKKGSIQITLTGGAKTLTLASPDPSAVAKPK